MRPTNDRLETIMKDAHLRADDAGVLAAEVRALREELEIERMRLAACGVAACGAGDEHFVGMAPEYDSGALRSTRKLHATLERVGELPNMWRGEWEESGHDYEYFSCLNCADQLETVLKRTP